jgi:hypothetical protein
MQMTTYVAADGLRTTQIELSMICYCNDIIITYNGRYIQGYSVVTPLIRKTNRPLVLSLI